jgi:signal transduction histidine kinase
VVNPFHAALAEVSPPAPHVTLDLRFKRSDGEEKAVRFSHAFLFADGRPVRDVVIVSDLTARRRAERMKTDFVATVSHELRTPLTPIKGYAELLRNRGDDVPPAKRDRALDLIIDRANHLGRLVDDLLLASSITSDTGPQHQLDCTTQDLVGLVTRAVGDFPDAAERVTVTRPTGVVLARADVTRTVQILTNLVSNALKYSSPGTPITITFEEAEAWAMVTVSDLGPGIPHDQLSRVFEKFHRVEDPMVMSTSGTGLGLFISKHFARVMDGDLSVASTLGAGSQFTLRLPSGDA